jgi:UDP-N-acetylglucosamine--N-acetylmuramyl-(pentapeptide) pyrophosphoryl-undecaprenol N-acetylglucosamine transferase
MNKRILMAVGGTGGHVYPALALAQELLSSMPCLELFFAGGHLASNRYFDTTRYGHQSIACGTLSLKKPVKSLVSVGKILQGIWQSQHLLKQFRPNLVIGFGSFHTLPLLIAAKRARIPLVLHEANSLPGKVNRLLSKYAVATGVHFPSAAQHLRGKSMEVGMPLREGFRKNFCTKEQAIAAYDLDEKRHTLLVFGGSQGAQALNALVGEALCQPLSPFRSSIQVIHITGKAASVPPLQERYKQAGVKACVKEFEPRMNLAWQAADLVIARAGASTLAEACEWEVPAILIPFPHAADNHQAFNALFYAETVGGGMVFEERKLTGATLACAIQDWLQDEGRLLEVKRQAICLYKKKRRTLNFASFIQSLL